MDLGNVTGGAIDDYRLNFCKNSVIVLECGLSINKHLNVRDKKNGVKIAGRGLRKCEKADTI
jgi:hypothetical protein